MALKIMSNYQRKLLGYGTLCLMVLGASPASAVVSSSTNPINYSYMGDLGHAAQIPCGFGPFKAPASTVGVYRGRLQVFSDDLKGQPLFLVIRIHEDKTHSFGWIRAYVNDELVATEAQLKESRIVVELTKVLRPGNAQVSIMGAAYPGTSMDFYVVPRDSVLTAIQGKPLGKVLYAVGPFKIEAKQQEEFSQSFELTADEAKSRLMLSLRLFAKDKHLGWERLYLNGQLLASDKDFSPDGQTTTEITGKATEGINKIVMRGAASPGTPAVWYLMQMPLQREATRGGVSEPAITHLDPAEEASANEIIEIHGRNFDPDPSNNKVMLDDKALSVQSSSKDKLTVLVPLWALSGASNLVVEVQGEPSDSFPIKIAGVPHVSSTSVSQCPAGYEFIIYGDNFPESLDKVKVMLGSAPATVLASCKQSLLVRMPAIDPASLIKDKSGRMPVKVSVAKLESKENVYVTLAGNVIKSAQSGPPLLLVSSQNQSKSFDEKTWRLLMDKAEASSKESRFEAAEFYFNESIGVASQAQTISKFMIDSLSGLAGCYRAENLTEEAKHCDEIIQAFASAKNPGQ